MIALLSTSKRLGIPLPEPSATPVLVNPGGMPAPADRSGPQFPAAPPPQPSAAERIDRLIAVATEHEQAGRLDQAENILGQVLAEAPERHGAVHLMGIVAYRKGRVD